MHQQVHPVDEGPGNALSIGGDLIGPALAWSSTVPQIATGTGIGGGDQVKARGKANGDTPPSHGDEAIFQWLT
jgi:hypothetical protein